MIKYITILILLLSITSCKTVHLQHSIQSITDQKVMLGSIGLDKNAILEHHYSTTAIPNYTSPIKLSVTKVPFSKITYQAFTKAKEVQGTKVTVKYTDSLDIKPTFLKLDVADKVTLLKALNDRGNKNVKDYLSANNNAVIITSVSLALNRKLLNEIITAESVFLIENSPKSYAIQLIDNTIVTQTIPLNTGVVFTYDSSNCCWQANNAYRINVVDLVVGKTNCPNRTYPSTQQAKRKINYYKL